jgi:hypothetical protein
MLANLASLIALQKGDYLEARRLARLATDHGLDELKPIVARNLWETRIKASLALGDLSRLRLPLATWSMRWTPSTG